MFLLRRRGGRGGYVNPTVWPSDDDHVNCAMTSDTKRDEVSGVVDCVHVVYSQHAEGLLALG